MHGSIASFLIPIFGVRLRSCFEQGVDDCRVTSYDREMKRSLTTDVLAGDIDLFVLDECDDVLLVALLDSIK